MKRIRILFVYAFIVSVYFIYGQSFYQTFPYNHDGIVRGVAQNGNELVFIGRRDVCKADFTRPSQWNRWYSIGVPSDLNDIEWGDSLYVATLISGAIYSSPDGEAWTERQSGFATTLRDIEYAGSFWTIVGDSGVILYSPDGMDWDIVQQGTRYNLHDVLWADSQCIAVGDSGTILTSEDGTNWIRRSLDNFPDSIDGSTLWSIAWNGTYFVAGIVIDNSKFSWHTLQSEDLATWTFCAQEEKSVKEICTLKNNFYGGFCNECNFCASQDGCLWHCGGAFDDGSRIRTFASSTDSALFAGTFFDEDELFAHIFFKTADGPVKHTSWILTSQLRDAVDFHNRTFIIGDEETILYADTTYHWNSRPPETLYNLYSVAATEKYIAAVGEGGTIITSTDGRKWEYRNSNTKESLNAIVCNENKAIACGNAGVLVSSEDGRQWNMDTSLGSLSLYSIAYTGDEYVIGADSGKMFASAMGNDWQEITTNLTTPVTSILWGNNIYATLIEGAPYYGKKNEAGDSILWHCPESVKASYTFNDLCWTGSYFAALLQNGIDIYVYLSKDCVNWEEKDNEWFAYYERRNTKATTLSCTGSKLLAFSNYAEIAVFDNITEELQVNNHVTTVSKKPSITIRNGTLSVTTAEKSTINLFDLSGRSIGKITTPDIHHTISLSQSAVSSQCLLIKVTYPNGDHSTVIATIN